MMAPMIDARVQVPQSRRKKVCMMPFSSFAVLVVFVPVAALRMQGVAGAYWEGYM